ncbi:acyl-CoA synthetase [Rhodococcus sp. X156]|uniref:acyl-CoA synthetase n=1 Tax=Rhodococcus sp. X156 TaxID=2499145 RepID=UPI000FD76AFF|nr:acyl-CoA synthetase [Rhodococcus sp. X156]
MPLLSSLSGELDDSAAAVTVGDRSVSREQLLAAATAVATEVAGASSVAIDARAELETVVAVTGCLLAGVPAVPVPPDSGERERQHLLADSGAQLWLGAPRDDVQVPVVPVDARARSAASLPAVDEDAPALIVYTSGTTGAPKGVVHSGRSVAACLDGLASAWQWTAEDTLVHGLPLFHVHGLVLGVLGALRVGSPLVHTVRPTAQGYAAAPGTLYFGVPTVWSRMCDDATALQGLAHARLLVSGSAPLPVSVFQTLAAATGKAPIERYGMTETLITVSTRFDGERRPGWVGTRLDGVRTRLRAESGALAPHDGTSMGQLEVHGPTLFDGYLNAPERTTEVMGDDGWFATGDIAVIDPGGFHRIVGRESVDLIKSGGYRIGAGEVEHALLVHPTVREVAVVGVPDPDLGQRIVAYVVGEGCDEKTLIDFVATTLSVHKRPRAVRVVSALPRNEMGKVQKKALMAEGGSS